LPLDQRFPRVAFGTSGVRALVSDLRPEVVAAYVAAFVRRMRVNGHLIGQGRVAVAMDLRPSSPMIAAAVCQGLNALGHAADFLGALPTPALALHCLHEHTPGVMITGSHIPFDRNGLKFYSPAGEILKADEAAMLADTLGADSQPFETHETLPAINPAAAAGYMRRYLDRFGQKALGGLRIGFFEHSAVGRDLTCDLLRQMGAIVVPLGRSDHFVPVDTEAVAAADLAQARTWCAEHRLDALASTDGDGDRPLVFDERGEFVRGDLLGLLCARSLGIPRLAVPISCNTAIERSGAFSQVVRTRIGSPFVIEAMQQLQGLEPDTRAGAVAGFEANGGFLLATALDSLAALPTRDALLPMLTLLAEAAARRCAISTLTADLPQRFVHSDRLQNLPSTASRALLAALPEDAHQQCALTGKMQPPLDIDTRDGVRMRFADGDIIHLRASGNAPELRCYAESADPEAARLLCAMTLNTVKATLCP
jgi:phosphomannomutase